MDATGMSKATTHLKPFDALADGMPAVPWIEQFVLGYALQYPEHLPEFVSDISLDDFATEGNRIVWAALCTLHEAGTLPTLHAVATELHRHGQLEAAGSFTRLMEIVEGVPQLRSLAGYVAQLRDATQRRRAIQQAEVTKAEAGARDCDTAALLVSAAENYARFAADLNPEVMFKTGAKILANFGGMNRYSSGADHPERECVTTPFPTLNRIIPAGGFVPGDLVILAGHTGRGKTAFAVNLAFHAAARGKHTAVVSLEMPEDQIFDRLIGLAANMDSYTLRRQNSNMHEEAERKNRIREAIGMVTSMPLLVTFRPGINPKALQGELRKLQTRQGLDLVIVDYLQLMSGGSTRYSNRTEEVSAISRALKRIAGELSVPVVALSQFSRESAKENREPALSDLRESGSIEQDGSLVLFVHFTRAWDMRAGVDTGDAKLIVAKQRNGACTWIPLQFHAPTGRFYEPENERTSGGRN